jgi:hypothetical protein
MKAPRITSEKNLTTPAQTSRNWLNSYSGSAFPMITNSNGAAIRTFAAINSKRKMFFFEVCALWRV